MRNPPALGTRAFLTVCAVFIASGCIDDDAVYDGDAFAGPPSQAAGFLGYSDHEAQLTACGNCHEELQADWEATAHAHAWMTLEALGPAQDGCKGCHSVNALGNPTVGNGGYTSTGDERYEDVQCESCHGPGLEHALDPSRRNAPTPTLNEGLGATSGCGECHQGAEQPYLEEWAASRHGQINVYPAGQPGCENCHTGEGALDAWGLSLLHVEDGSFEGPGQHMAITCGICHDPHGGFDGAQLRFAVSVPSLETNLCMKCHQERAMPDPNNERGPHAPEGPVLLGTAGWWPTGIPQTRMVGSHGDPAVNDGLCATCHMSSFANADFSWQSTGHVFSAIPCLDAQGRPIASGECADTQRTFEACAGSGCHGSESDALAARTAARARIDDLVVELRSLLADVPRSEFNPNDAGLTTAEGARFNAQLAEKRGSVEHNPAMLEALLLQSIEAVERSYGLQAGAAVLRTPLFGLK